MNLIYVRHGETHANARNLMQGLIDNRIAHLNELGIKQAKHVAVLLKDRKIDAIYCSDLTRAVQTANEIHKMHQNVKVVKTAMLRERHHGSFEGKALPAGTEGAYHAARYSVGTTPGGGEQLEDAYDRIFGVLEGMLEKHKGDTVLVVAHGSIGRIVVAIIEGVPIREINDRVNALANATPIEFEVKDLKYMGVQH